MSRARPLPDRPNLEHLKKQAKALHRRMQHENAAHTFADALHALAHEYGVASWPKLKAHVESLLATTERREGQAGPGGAAAPPSNPFAGRWMTDLSRSIRHPLQDFQVAHLHIEVVGDIVTLLDLVVDPSGKEEQHVNTLEANGREHPLKIRWLCGDRPVARIACARGSGHERRTARRHVDL